MAKIIYSIGVLTVAVVALQVIKTIRIFLLPSKLSRYAHPSPNGDAPWALVTGASDGIGRSFAHELAAKGFNVVLHGRNHEKLSGVMAQLREEYPERAFRILVADAANVPCMNCLPPTGQQPGNRELSGGAVDFDAIRAAVKDLHLTVLINNAGNGPTNPTFLSLSESSETRITANVSLNALFPLHLTRALLPTLIKSSPSLVMNISSISDMGFPLLVSYSASKQFLMNLTLAVGREMALHDTNGPQADVELLGIRVGRTTGVTHDKQAPSLFVPSASALARAALDRAGHGHGVITGYWAHELQQLGFLVMPLWAQSKIMVATMGKLKVEETQKLKRT